MVVTKDIKEEIFKKGGSEYHGLFNLNQYVGSTFYFFLLFLLPVPFSNLANIFPSAQLAVLNENSS